MISAFVFNQKIFDVFKNLMVMTSLLDIQDNTCFNFS